MILVFMVHIKKVCKFFNIQDLLSRVLRLGGFAVLRF